MMSMLHIARSALLVHQRTAEVISNNIANSETPGYTRQRAVLRPIGGMHMPATSGVYGGVEVQEVQRIRSGLFDSLYRREVTSKAQNEVMATWLQQVETMFGDLNGSPLGTAIDTFYNAWGDLSISPSSESARILVRDAGESVAQQFNQIGAQLAEIRSDLVRRLEQDAAQLARYSAEIGQLNVQILAAREGAPALEDRRDVLLDELGALVGARIVQQTRGDFTVIAGSSVLLDGVSSPEITISKDDAGKYVLLKADGTTVDPQGGRLAGYLGLLNDDLPKIMDDLDNLVRGFVEHTNAIHRTGVLADGETNIDFFDPIALGATSIRVSSIIAADISRIATSTVQSTGGNDLALTMASSRGDAIARLGDRSVTDSFNALVVGIGTATNTRMAASEASSLLLETIELQRMSESGVSPEEEMISLIQTQAAYQAAARVLTVADEMLQEILNIRR